MSKIVVEPEKLKLAAAQIKQQAEDYEQQYNLLFIVVDGLGSVWKGADNIAFVNQIHGFMDDFQKMKQLMIQYAEFLENSAKLYDTTQQDRIAKAQSLTN